MAEQTETVEQQEYIVELNLKWPDEYGLEQIGEPYAHEYQAARALIDLLNKHFPGKWEPENIGSASLRFAHVSGGAGLILLGRVRQQPARAAVLEQRLIRAREDVEFAARELESAQRLVAQLESQYAALKNNAGS